MNLVKNVSLVPLTAISILCGFIFYKNYDSAWNWKMTASLIGGLGFLTLLLMTIFKKNNTK